MKEQILIEWMKEQRLNEWKIEWMKDWGLVKFISNRVIE